MYVDRYQQSLPTADTIYFHRGVLCARNSDTVAIAHFSKITGPQGVSQDCNLFFVTNIVWQMMDGPPQLLDLLTMLLEQQIQ